jgi:F-type H+-transporting ATPase subunit gamma
MAGTKEIKRRIKSIRNTKKITKAMELVAASKMKRAVASTLRSRLYAEYSSEVLAAIGQNVEEIKSPFFNEREVKNTLVVLITSNRGLCGAYNAQVIKKAISLIKNESSKVEIVSVGKKGDVAMRRVGENVVASFFELSDAMSMASILPVSKMLIDGYGNGDYDKVYIVYTDFISTLTQKPNIKQILPISKRVLESNAKSTDYLFEGDRDELINEIAEKITRMQIFQTILESNASEQSSRMMAMKNASEASGEMIEDLTLIFNKARQSNITREISEISAGMASVS